MKRGLVIILAAVLLLSSTFVMAVRTDVVVNTAPNHDVTISFYGEGDSQLLKQMKGESLTGNFSAFYEGNQESLRIIVFLAKFGEKVKLETYDGVDAGGVIEYDIYPDDYVKPEI